MMTGAYRGVCFSGEPGALGWMNRAAQAFDKREMGSNIGQYRVKGAPQMEDAPEPETGNDDGRTGTRAGGRPARW